MRLRFVLILGAAVVGIAGGDACTASNDQTLVITRAYPPAPAGAGACTRGDAFIVSGVLDLDLVQRLQRGYVLFPSVANHLVSNAQYNNGIESNMIMITGADIDITYYPALPEAHFREPIFDVLQPGQEDFIPVDLIPPPVAVALPQEDRVATVKVHMLGTANGTDVKSNEMTFSVTLCRGCLENNVGPCCGPAAQAGSCNPVQDAPIDCCTNSSGMLICPAQALAGSVCGTDAGAP